MTEPLEVELRIEVPVELTEKEKKLLLAEIEKTSIRKVIADQYHETQRHTQMDLVPVPQWKA